MEYVKLAVVVTLLTRFLFRGCDCIDALDIILWSNGSSVASGQSVKSLRIDVVNGSNTTLQAVMPSNFSTGVRLYLEWHKDGSLVPAPYKMRRFSFTPKETTGVVHKAYLSLLISAVYETKSGNYSVTLDNGSSILAEAYVMVTVGDEQRPAFTFFPEKMTNCSSNNSSTGLSYAAIGFPTPVYTLKCSGMQYESQPSTSGEFIIPPDVCCMGAKCLATVFNNYHEPIDSPPAIVKQHSQSPSCRQQIGDLMSGLVILRHSQTLASSESDLNGKVIEVTTNDVNATLEALFYQNVSDVIQFQLRWFKDGGTIDSLSRISRVCNGSPDWGSLMRCSLRLPLFSIYGNLSGNYSVELRQANATDIMVSAWLMVIVGEVKRPSFTVVPESTTNCSSANQSMILNYVAVGFPRPVYTLRCSGVQYESKPSTSGEFIIPPEVCCLGSYCVASADNGYGSPVDSTSTIVRDMSASGSCQQHIACLSTGVEIFLKSCASTTHSSDLNGRTTVVAADDLNATLEAVSYQKSSTFTRLQVTWSKDGRKINVSDNTAVQPCVGNETWGSWTRCGFRLPLAALKSNLFGNYSVELRQADVAGVLASAWVVITVGTQGLHRCSTRDTAQAYPDYVLTKFPSTCNARCSCTSSTPYFIASASASGFVVVIAVIVTALYCRKRKIRMLAALKRRSVQFGVTGHSNITGEPCSEHETPTGIQSFCSDVIPRDSPLSEQKSYYIHQPFKLEVNGSEHLLETDGGSASLAMQSSFIDDATSQVDQRDRCATPGLSSAVRLPVITDATASTSLGCTRPPSTLVLINACNVQLGSGNTMIINSNPGCTCDSLVEAGCSTSSLASENYDNLSDEIGAKAPKNFQLELDEDCHSAFEAEYFSASIFSEICRVASDESGTQAIMNYHQELDEDCDRPVQCASPGLPEHDCSVAQPLAYPDLVLGVP